MPDVLLPLTEMHCQVQLMTLEAAITGDKELALHALMCDPMCGHLSPSQTREMGLKLMKATRQWLPQFKIK